MQKLDFEQSDGRVSKTGLPSVYVRTTTASER